MYNYMCIRTHRGTGMRCKILTCEMSVNRQKLTHSLSHLRYSNRIFSCKLYNFSTTTSSILIRWDHPFWFGAYFFCFVWFWRVDIERADISSNFILKNYLAIYLDNLKSNIWDRVKWMTTFFPCSEHVNMSRQDNITVLKMSEKPK